MEGLTMNHRILTTTRRAALRLALTGAGAVATATTSYGGHFDLSGSTPARGYIKGPFGLLHYYDNGERLGRPLLMFHQAPMSARQFDSVYEPLARRGIRAIGIDLPGFGMSDPTPFVPRCEDWALIAPAILDHFDIARVDVLGHHTGAMIATEIGIQFPDRVRRLILNGPMPMNQEERKRRLDWVKTAEIDFKYEADGSHLASSFRSRYKMYAAAAKPEVRLITRYTVEKFMGLAPFWYGHNAAFQYDHERGLRTLKVRTLLLTNTGDQIYEHCQIARHLRPDFAYVELQGGGIDVVDQLPEEWADAVANFTAGAS